jgi:hypothetical protein
MSKFEYEQNSSNLDIRALNNNLQKFYLESLTRNNMPKYKNYSIPIKNTMFSQELFSNLRRFFCRRFSPFTRFSKANNRINSGWLFETKKNSITNQTKNIQCKNIIYRRRRSILSRSVENGGCKRQRYCRCRKAMNKLIMLWCRSRVLSTDISWNCK